MSDMKRREFITFVASAAVAGPITARAQQPGKVPRIGYLAAGSPPANPAFWQGMRDLGYIEGENILVEYRWAQGKPERLPDLAAELMGLKPEAVFAFGTQATFATKGVGATTPVIFHTHADPVETGFVSSLARPGGMYSGVTLMAPELAGKRLELLKNVIPTASHIAVLVNMANPGMQSTVKHLEAAAGSLQVKLQVLDARAAGEVEGTFVAKDDGFSNALYVTLDPLFLERRTQIVELAAKKRLPALYDVREFVQTGGLMSYGPSLAESFRRAAYYVDRILKGAKPVDLPVEQPTRFDLVINLKTTKALGLAIPPAVLAVAGEVIE
jgi:putative tryptophan/tyrosine transport system substrate-binding protein